MTTITKVTDIQALAIVNAVNKLSAANIGYTIAMGTNTPDNGDVFAEMGDEALQELKALGIDLHRTDSEMDRQLAQQEAIPEGATLH